jgi:predicted porin
MGGRARVGFAYDIHEDHSFPDERDTGWAVKGGYNLGVVNLGAALERMDYGIVGGECEAQQWGLAASVPVGAGSVKASFAKADELEGPACTTGNAGKAKTWNLGYEHRFSKRTSVAFGYAEVDNDDGSPAPAAFTWTGVPPGPNGATNGPVAGGDVSTFFVNITHRF